MRIPLDRRREVPLYVQIQKFLREGDHIGKLPAGTRLPGVEAVSRDLGVSRVTVETAYADLEAEGSIARRLETGQLVSFVADSLGSAKGDGEPAWPLWQRELMQSGGFPMRGATATVMTAGAAGVTADILSNAGSNKHAGTKSELISLAGFGDPRLSDQGVFRGPLREVVRRDGAACLEMGDKAGLSAAKGSIAHILTSQGIEAHPDNVLVTSVHGRALGIVAQLLLKPGGTPSWWKAPGVWLPGRFSYFEHAGCGSSVAPPPTNGAIRSKALEPLLQNTVPTDLPPCPPFKIRQARA